MNVKSITAGATHLRRRVDAQYEVQSQSGTQAQNIVANYRLELISDVASFASQWQEFEKRAIGTLFQSHKWISSWLRTAAAAKHEHPLIVAGYDASEQLAFILPFAMVTKSADRSSAATLTWLGSDQTSYNLGIYRPDVMTALTGSDLRAIIDHVAQNRTNVKAVTFTNQPLIWEGVANPMAALPQHPAHGSSYELELQQDFAEIYEEKFSGRSRSTLRRKERQLAKQGNVRTDVASSKEQRLKFFKIFAEQKAAQFAEHGIQNFLDDPVTNAFYLDLVNGNENDPIFEQSYTQVGNEVAATFNGLAFKDRFYFIQTSMTLGPLRKWSPGLLVMKQNVAWACERGLKHFDLGPGQGSHKAAWHGNEIKMFDTYIPLRAAGLPSILGHIVLARAIHFAKTHKAIATAARSFRKIIRLAKAKIGR